MISYLEKSFERRLCWEIHFPCADTVFAKKGLLPKFYVVFYVLLRFQPVVKDLWGGGDPDQLRATHLRNAQEEETNPGRVVL